MKANNTIKKVLGIGLAFLGAILLKALIDDGENTKYSAEWFESISDDEFYAEREPVRKKARENGGDVESERLLQRFNNEEVRRMNAKYEQEHPNASPVHREHGWYLPNDD